MKISFRFVVIIVFILVSNPIFAQSWEWAKGANGGDDNEAWSVAADGLGNVFGVGFSGGLTEQFGSILLSGFGKRGVILVKYDSTGKLLWAANTKNSFAQPLNISTDALGNLYLYGFYTDPTLTVGSVILTNPGTDMEYFVAKYTPSGTVAWAINAGSSGSSSFFNLGGCSTDAAGNTYITAPFGGPTLSIGSITINNTVSAGGPPDIYIAKIDASGNPVWIKDAGGTGSEYPTSIAVTKNGKLYVGGMFTSPTLTFNTSVLPFAGTGTTTMFVAKFDTSGNPIWGKCSGGDGEVLSSTAVDQSDNVFIAGYFHGSTLVFGSITLTCAASTYTDFLTKYDSSGKILWANQVTGDQHPYCFSVATDFCGNAWISGSFEDSVNIAGNMIRSKLPLQGDPLYIAGYDPSGALIDYASLPTGGDDNNAICADPSGNLYVGMDFLLAPFIVGKDTLKLPFNGEDIGVVKYSRPIAIDTTDTSSSLTICTDTTTLSAPAGYQNYLWDDGTTLPTRKVTTAGKYFVYCRNCGVVLADTFDVIRALPDTTFNHKDSVVCATETTVSISGPTGFSGYLWSSGDTAMTISVKVPGSYFVSADSGCSRIVDTFNLTAATAPVVLLKNDTIYCIGVPVTLSSVQPGGSTYLWSTGSHDVSITVFEAGKYWLTVTNAYGCSTTDTAIVFRAPSSALTHLSHVTPAVSIKYGSSVQLNADNETFYFWKPNDGSLSDPNINDPVATPQNSTIYTVLGYDNRGCIDSATVTVTVDSTMNECIPSAFTPNGDGLNDIFRPACLSFQTLLDFRIYNRWGQEIFYSNNYKVGWDGTFGGQPQEIGTYFYMMILARPGGANVIYKGDVTLIR